MTAWDVIEHLDDPRRALAECRRNLEPGGWIFLSTPDAGSIVGRIMGHRWHYQDPVQHINLLSRYNLDRLLRESGFRVAGHITFGRSYRVSYIVSRLIFLLEQHPLGAVVIVVVVVVVVILAFVVLVLIDYDLLGYLYNYLN